MRIGLVSCGKRKRDDYGVPYAARDLYTSALFRKAAAYAEATYDRWYIVSALHGLVAPDDPLTVYNVALDDLTPAARDEWARGIGRALAPWVARGDTTFYLHAGGRYAQLIRSVVRVERPLQGLGIGQQLRWYKERGF